MELRRLGLLAVVSAGLVLAQRSVPESIQDVSIEQLWNTEVTSVSRKAQPLSRTAAAVYGATATGARTASIVDAAAILERGGIDLVLAELRLEDGDGFEVVHAGRRAPSRNSSS